jgi:hypothetical protein
MKRTQGGDRTFDTVRSRYDAWATDRPPRPTAQYDDWSPSGPEEGVSMSRMVFAAIGVGIGVILLALAAYSFYVASWWAGYGREPAVIGFTTTGVFLLVAGVGGIASTLNHIFRVLDPNRRHAHAHH